MKNKYSRRIKRLYANMIQPSLLIRYCEDEFDVVFLAEHYEQIISFLKGYNQENELIVICHSDIDPCLLGKIPYCYTVDKDADNRITINPILKCQTVLATLENAKYEGKNDNLAVYRKKEMRKNSPQIAQQLRNSIVRKLIRCGLIRQYYHNKVVD